ncbi:MAG: NAD-dependent epimerase/dehydratase family protein [Cyclobacteriaceae bacterium]
MGKTLIIGACGQLGSELTMYLRDLKGNDQVVAADISEPVPYIADGPFEKLNIMDKEQFHQVLEKHNIREVYHLAAILSAKGEQNPLFAWQLNMDSLLLVLEAARERKIDKIYWPSSIAVFGPDTPKDQTPQNTVMNPNTVYGISKQAGERWCQYYFDKYQVDVRSIRYPGLIGYKTKPGGGTTDYAVDIFFKAVEEQPFDCFLKADTELPMMYMNDAVRATVELMEAPSEDIHIRSSYNLAAISFTPEEIYQELKKHFPDFSISYNPDFRQAIADSWPNSIDDSAATEDWGWQPGFDLAAMTDEIISKMTEKI